MIKKQILLFLIGGISCANAMSLKEAIAMAKENNSQLKVSKAEVNTSDARVNVAKNERYPSLSASAQFLNMFDTAETEIRIPMVPPSEGGKSPEVKPDNAFIGRLTFNMPLFAGFKIKNGVAVAQYTKALSDLSLQDIEQDVILQVVSSYVGLYKVRKAKEVVEANLKSAKQRVSHYESMVKNGMMARNDLLRAQLQQSNVELSLVETSKQERLLNYQLATLIGASSDQNIETELNFSTPDISEQENSYITKAEVNRPDLQMLATQQQIADKRIAMEKANYYPIVALTGSYMYLDAHNIVALKNSTNIGIGLSYDLSSLFKNKANVELAKGEAEKLVATQQAMKDKIQMLVRSAYEEYNYSIDKTAVYKKALEQASENYRIVSMKSDAGLATVDDLLTADVEQLQAQINEAYGEADIMLAYYNLLRETGILDIK